MRGYLSQGLVLKYNGDATVGSDITEQLNIKDFTEQDDEPATQPSKPKNWFIKFLMRFRLTRWIVFKFMPKKARYTFPEFISKTDETRIQNVPQFLKIEAPDWVATEKIDGQSGTWIVRREKNWLGISKNERYICSRNLRLNPPYDKDKSQVALDKKLRICDQLEFYLNEHPEEEWVALQGECIGPRIQGNPYKVKDFDLYLFNMITSKKGLLPARIGIQHTNTMAVVSGLEKDPETIKMKWAPVDFENEDLPNTFKEVNDILEYANGFSKLNPKVMREGIVVRSYAKHISFKAVSPEYLIKKGE